MTRAPVLRFAMLLDNNSEINEPIMPKAADMISKPVKFIP
jgi:hypothetical protein